MSDYCYGVPMPWEMDNPTADNVIRALCALQLRVFLKIDPGYELPNDCFCNKSPSLPFRTSGLAVKRIFEAVERDVFGQTTMTDIEHAPPSTIASETPRRYWVGKNGAVVSNWPAIRKGYSAVHRQGMLDGASEWAHSGGFLVCESCTSEDAQRIVDALNASEEAGQ